MNRVYSMSGCNRELKQVKMDYLRDSVYGWLIFKKYLFL